MMINTDRGNSIREAYIIQELCFSLYVKYQRDFEMKNSKKQIESADKAILKLKIRNEKLKMRRHHPQLTVGFCFYVHHNREILKKNRYKIGKTKNIQFVLKAARRTDPYTIVDFIMYLDEQVYDLVERMVKTKLINKRKPRPHEIVYTDLQEIIDAAISVCNATNIKYSIGNQEEIDAYNKFIIEETSADEIDPGTEADNENVEEPPKEDENDEKIENKREGEYQEDEKEEEKEAEKERPIPQIIYNTTNITNNFNTPPASQELSPDKALEMIQDLKNMTCVQMRGYLEKYNQPIAKLKEKLQKKLQTYLVEILIKHGCCPENLLPRENTRPPPKMTGVRKCAVCRKQLSITKFWPKIRGKNGRDNTCSECRNDVRRRDREQKRNEKERLSGTPTS